MAGKRIFKFLLRIAVVIAILLGIYFGISAINSNKNANVKIIEASQSAKITTKIGVAYNELVEIAENNSPQKFMVMRCNDITTALMEYYNHYLNLTCFENTSNSGNRDTIISKINTLSKWIDETDQRLDNTKKITGNNTEKNKRFIKTLESYFEQTKVLIELDELLKNYVYTVNYGVVSTGIPFEAQLEMIKDYSKVVFNEAIYGKQEATTTSVMLTNDVDETGFVKVMKKFLERSAVATNNDKEVYFSQDYMSIDKQNLTDFYKQTSSVEKNEKINQITDNETLKINLTKVYRYINQTSF